MELKDPYQNIKTGKKQEQDNIKDQCHQAGKMKAQIVDLEKELKKA